MPLLCRFFDLVMGLFWICITLSRSFKDVIHFCVYNREDGNFGCWYSYRSSSRQIWFVCYRYIGSGHGKYFDISVYMKLVVHITSSTFFHPPLCFPWRRKWINPCYSMYIRTRDKIYGPRNFKFHDTIKICLLYCCQHVLCQSFV